MTIQSTGPPLAFIAELEPGSPLDSGRIEAAIEEAADIGYDTLLNIIWRLRARGIHWSELPEADRPEFRFKSNDAEIRKGRWSSEELARDRWIQSRLKRAIRLKQEERERRGREAFKRLAEALRARQKKPM